MEKYPVKTGGIDADIMETTAADLLSIAPLIFRRVRRKLIESTPGDIDVHITPLGFEILRLLEEEGTLHIAEIGGRLHIAKAQMTQLIDALVKLGLIEKKPDAVDRRLSNITIIEHGKTIVRQHKEKLLRAARESLSSLTSEELQNVSDALRKLRDILARK